MCSLNDNDVSTSLDEEEEFDLFNAQDKEAMKHVDELIASKFMIDKEY